MILGNCCCLQKHSENRFRTCDFFIYVGRGTPTKELFCNKDSGKLIGKLKTGWVIPKITLDNGERSFFKFACEFNLGIGIGDDKIPLELYKFYEISNGAILFKDVDFGHWGLKIIPYDNLYQFNSYTRSWRGDDIEDADLIIGEFLGDLDLVIMSLAEYNYGQVIICTEIEKRKDWHFLKMNFEEFLQKYFKSEGDKFWKN